MLPLSITAISLLLAIAIAVAAIVRWIFHPHIRLIAAKSSADRPDEFIYKKM